MPKVSSVRAQKAYNCKGQQAEARKGLKYGVQASYFNRLWKRLHNATSIGGTPEVLVRQYRSGITDNGVGDDNTDDEKTIGFNSHLDLLEFIDKVAPWNKEADLVAAVNLYDNALHHGGRIYRTNAAPSHFSSEWLLAKISPVSLHKHCSGAGLHG